MSPPGVRSASGFGNDAAMTLDCRWALAGALPAPTAARQAHPVSAKLIKLAEAVDVAWGGTAATAAGLTIRPPERTGQRARCDDLGL